MNLELGKMTNKSNILEDYKFLMDKNPVTVIRSAGSTTKAMYIPVNKIDLDVITEVGARCWRNAGVTPGMRVINTLNSSMYGGGTMDTLSLSKAGACVLNFSVGNRKELIQVIIDLKVEAISCTPSYLNKLKVTLNEEYGMNPSQLGLKYILLGGEAGCQNPEFRNNIEETWDCEVIDANYGMVDVCSMYASENSFTKDGLQFMGYDYIDVKILINGLLKNPERGLKGEMVVTTLWNGGLINRYNYRTGDIVEILEVYGDGRFRFKVTGRADEMLIIRGLNVYPDTIFKVVEKCKREYGVDFYAQLHVSKDDPIENVKLWISESMEEDFFEEVTNYLATELKKVTSINVQVCLVSEDLLITKNDKVKRIIRDL